MISKERLAANFAGVWSRIETACRRVDRKRDSVTLVAVSKLHPPEAIRLAWELGHRDFGENYAQELRDKNELLSNCVGLRWHAIGPLQPKNAKYVAKAAHVFHALDRFDVAEALSKRRTGTALRCLVEVNMAEESSKAGLQLNEVAAFVAQVRSLEHLDLVGLTAMPPVTADAEDNRVHFKRMAALARALGLPELSMGTTPDFEVAIEEGATLVRVGTALFGERATG